MLNLREVKTFNSSKNKEAKNQMTALLCDDDKILARFRYEPEIDLGIVTFDYHQSKLKTPVDYVLNRGLDAYEEIVSLDEESKKEYENIIKTLSAKENEGVEKHKQKSEYDDILYDRDSMFEQKILKQLYLDNLGKEE